MRRNAEVPMIRVTMMRRLLVVLAAAVLALAVQACGSDDSSGDGGSETTAAGGGTEAPAELREITIISPSGDHAGAYAPLYIGRELGFFEEEGLEVNLESGAGSSEAVQLLIAGQGEFALAGVEALMVAIDGGADVSGAYELYSRPSFGLVVPADSGITDVAELEGKTIGITDLAGGEVPVVVGLLTDAGVAVADVEIVPVGDQTPSIVEALESGRIDAFGGSATDFAGLTAVGVETTKLTTDKTEGFPGGAIAVRRDTYENDPDLVKSFLRAWAKAQHALVTVDGVSEAATHVQLPEFWEDEEAGQSQVDSFRPLFDLDPGQRYGEYFRDAWRDYVEYLALSLPGQDPFIRDADAFDVETAVIIEFVGDYNDFDKAEVEQKAAEYLAQHS